VKGHKIISLTVAPTQLGLPLNVMFFRVIKRLAGYRFVATFGSGKLFRVMNLGSIHLKQINYLSRWRQDIPLKRQNGLINPRNVTSQWSPPLRNPRRDSLKTHNRIFP